mgnify:CR=1 FL=1|jgi:uncharacterized protein (TIGR00730 family)
MAGEGTCEAPLGPKGTQPAQIGSAPQGATVGRVNICVYCASNVGDDPAFGDAAAAVGRAIVGRGADLVYGGGDVGLMGIVANEVLAGGRSVTGIITEHLMKPEVAHRGLDELVVVADMPERKRAMFDRADAFITLPGGVGTMEEMFEVLCWSYLGLHPKPMGLLNVAGYYDHLIGFLDQAIGHGLCRPRVRDLLLVGTDVEDLFDRLFAQDRSPDGAVGV